jgi:uncharacterized protein (TIGR02246 family)
MAISQHARNITFNQNLPGKNAYCRVISFSLPAKPRVKALREIDMAKMRLMVFTAFVLLAVFVAFSFAAEKDIVRAQDRVAIEQLMWDYIRALDSGNADAYAAVFAPDGQFGRGANAIKGREALKKMILDARQKFNTADKGDKKAPRMYHVVTNPHIEFVDKDHARYYAYWMGALAAGGTTSAGREVNELVKINGQWLISLRDVDPQN